MKLGLNVETRSPEYVKVSRKTTETFVVAEISTKKKDFEIKTQQTFLDHMIEELAWFACMSIGVTVESLKNRRLSHTIAEDSGITLGKAFRVLYEEKMKEGLNGLGSSFSVLDESSSQAIISIEGRSNSYIYVDSEGGKMELVEDIKNVDLIAFIEGLAQGFGATIHLYLMKGRDPHHAWESAFRALGGAIKQAFEQNSWRKEGIAGIKGTLD